MPFFLVKYLVKKKQFNYIKAQIKKNKKQSLNRFFYAKNLNML